MKVGVAALRAALAVLGVVAFVGTAAAQSSTSGDIQGVVKDPSGNNVANATVVANGPQGARATTSDAQGNYLVEFLTPGVYDVTATAQGFQPVTQRGVQVRLGSRVTLNLALAPLAEAEETVTITASAPTVDTTSSSVNTEITSDLIGAVPTGRTFSGLVALAPGVVSGGLTGAGNPSIGGASGLENTFMINGVNTTNPGYGAVGSYSIVYGSLGSGVNFDFIDSVNVEGGGFEAEYGEAMGGVIQVTTKRGTNDFHGSFFANWQPGQLEPQRRQVYLTSPALPTSGPEYDSDVGVTVGGPLVKDKAFFFAAVNPQQSALSYRALNTPDTANLYNLGNQYSRKDRTSYAGTLTWNVVPNHTIELSLFGDPGRAAYGPQARGELVSDDTKQFSSLQFGGDNQVLRYNGVVGASLAIEATIANATNTFGQTFPSENDVPEFLDFRGPQEIQGGGLGFYEKNDTSRNTQYTLKLTNYFNAAGRHEVKYGVDYQDISYDANVNYTGPAGSTFTDENGVPHTLTTGTIYLIETADNGSDIYHVIRGDFSNPVRQTKTGYTSLFLQDKWSPIPTLTIDVGVRGDQQKLSGGGAGKSTYTFPFKNAIAPRLGVSYDFTGKGRGKVYAHYGQYYQKVPNDIAVRSMSSEQSVSFVDYYSTDFTAANQVPNGTDPLHGNTNHVSTTEGSTPIEPGTKSEYENEYVVGAEYEVAPTVNLGLRYMHRDLQNVIEDHGTQPAEDVLAGASNFGTYNVGNITPALNNTCPGVNGNPIGTVAFPNCWVMPQRTYDALDVTLEKRLTTNWQMLASYRLSRLYGNYEGLFRNDNGQSDPFISSLYDFPNNTPLMQGQAKKGLMNTDRTNVLKIFSSFQTGFGLNVGGGFTYQSGTPITGLLSHPIYGNQGEVPDKKGRGGYGRTPSTNELDVHADYGLPVRKGMDLRASVDIFNILDNQEVATVQQFEDLAPGVPNPDFLKATNYQAPRQVRLGLRLTF